MEMAASCGGNPAAESSHVEGDSPTLVVCENLGKTVDASCNEDTEIMPNHGESLHGDWLVVSKKKKKETSQGKIECKIEYLGYCSSKEI